MINSNNKNSAAIPRKVPAKVEGFIQYILVHPSIIYPQDSFRLSLIPPLTSSLSEVQIIREL